MNAFPIHANFGGRIVIIGFGSIGQGVLPLIFRHINLPKDKITIVTADNRGEEEAKSYDIVHGVKFIINPLTPENYREILEPLVSSGDFLLNLSVDVSSLALIKFCAEVGALYLDTCIEPWKGGYSDPNLSISERSNYALRESALTLKRELRDSSTAIVTHGANPGLVSHFVKQALLNIASDLGLNVKKPRVKQDWADLAHLLNVKVIHVSERDTQLSNIPKKEGEFVNTWSIDGFVSEGCQPAELGWGTHEKELPNNGEYHTFGCNSAIYMKQPGAGTKVRSWAPLAKNFHGFLVTHSESISIADYLTVSEEGRAVYRPTVHYSYHPCDDAVVSIHELAGSNWQQQPTQRLLMEEIVSGGDELGVLLAGHDKGAYWYGSYLTCEKARELVPYNNATSLQVCSSIIAGMVWAIENPNKGIVEPEDMDYERILEICTPYLGNVSGEYTDWTPLQDRGVLFPEDVDTSDPWQFKNILV